MKGVYKDRSFPFTLNTTPLTGRQFSHYIIDDKDLVEIIHLLRTRTNELVDVLEHLRTRLTLETTE